MVAKGSASIIDARGKPSSAVQGASNPERFSEKLRKRKRGGSLQIAEVGMTITFKESTSSLGNPASLQWGERTAVSLQNLGREVLKESNLTHPRKDADYQKSTVKGKHHFGDKCFQKTFSSSSSRKNTLERGTKLACSKKGEIPEICVHFIRQKS